MGNILAVVQSNLDYYGNTSSSSGGDGIVGLIFMCLWCGMLIFSIAVIGFWIYTLIDVIKHDFTKENDKIIWLLVVLLLGWIGALVYYFMVMRPAKY